MDIGKLLLLAGAAYIAILIAAGLALFLMGGKLMDIGKLLLLGGAAYIAYEYFIAPASTPVATAPGGIQAATMTTAPPAPPAANPLTTQGMVLGIANAQNPPFTEGTVDQWDYYYTQARGIPAPDPGGYVTSDQRAEILTFPEWWALASAHGLSGYRRAN